MATAATQLITAEEFMQMPDPLDGSQHELIHGVVVTMPPPKGRHGVCCSKTNRLLGNFIEPRKLGILTCNDTGFIVERDPDTVRGPDLAFWSSGRVSAIPDGYFELPPDLAIEVVSPSDPYTRLMEKVRYYLKHGVRLVWLIDPELRSVTVYRPASKRCFWMIPTRFPATMCCRASLAR